MLECRHGVCVSIFGVENPCSLQSLSVGLDVHYLEDSGTSINIVSLYFSAIVIYYFVDVIE